LTREEKKNRGKKGGEKRETRDIFFNIHSTLTKRPGTCPHKWNESGEEGKKRREKVVKDNGRFEPVH